MNDGILASRYDLACSPDWHVLVRLLEMGAGFAFVVLLVPDEEGARTCHDALRRHLEQLGKGLFDFPVTKPEDLQNLATGLRGLQIDAKTGAVWVGGVVSEFAERFGEWSQAWRTGLARLNAFRNPLRRTLQVPLIFVGAPWLQQVLREAAPDLWSVRTTVVWLEAQAMPLPEATGPVATPPLGSRAPDPEMALSEAQKLRERGGSALAIAQMFYRAGIGFQARSDWTSAQGAFLQCLDIRERHSGASSDLADTHLSLASVLVWLGQFDAASSHLLKASSLYGASGAVLGEANSIWWLGDVALRRGELDEARKSYEQALDLYRRTRHIPGEANSLGALAWLALRSWDLDEARRLWERALPLYRQLGDHLGQANCILGLGLVAFRSGDSDRAYALSLDAQALFRRGEHALGEANCLKIMGDVALQRSELEEAKRRIDEALPLYRRARDLLGEANCLSIQGDVEFLQGDFDKAEHYERDALVLYQQVADLLGEANCHARLGEIAYYRGDKFEAERLFEKSLTIYGQIHEPYSMGRIHRRLAILARTAEDRTRHIEAARELWRRIRREDLVQQLEVEFPEAAGRPS